MYNLLISECMKIKRNTVLKILLACIVFLSIAVTINNIYTVISSYGSIANIRNNAIVSSFCATLAIGNNFSNMTIPLCAFGAVYICYDFESKIYQSTVSAGCKKSKIFLSKMIIYFIIVAIMFLIHAAFAGILSSIVFKDFVNYNKFIIIEIIKIDLVNIIYNFARVTPVIFAAYLIRKTGLTVIVWGIIFVVIEKLWQGIIGVYPVAHKIYDNTLWMINKIICIGMSHADFVKVLEISSLYIIIFCGLSYIVFRKRALK